MKVNWMVFKSNALASREDCVSKAERKVVWQDELNDSKNGGWLRARCTKSGRRGVVARTGAPWIPAR